MPHSRWRWQPQWHQLNSIFAVLGNALFFLFPVRNLFDIAYTFLLKLNIAGFTQNWIKKKKHLQFIIPKRKKCQNKKVLTNHTCDDHWTNFWCAFSRSFWWSQLLAIFIICMSFKNSQRYHFAWKFLWTFDTPLAHGLSVYCTFPSLQFGDRKLNAQWYMRATIGIKSTHCKIQTLWHLYTQFLLYT